MTDVVASRADAAGLSSPPLLVLEPLRALLDANGLGSGPIDAAPIGDGHSNVTYRLRRDTGALVLRRPPRPPLPPSAHDVLREARLLQALQRTAVPVPPVRHVCADETVIGAPFYVMDEIHGVVITGTAPPPALDTPAERQRIGEALVDTLVTLHDVDWRACGLEGFGRPDGYLERQVRLFRRLWETNRTRTLPLVEQVAGRLAAHVPVSGAPAVVHGDFRLGNVMLAGNAPARIVALLDWELATIGDPLADVGYLLATWAEADDPHTPYAELSAATRLPGFPTRAQLAARYAERSGRSVADIAWYEALALFKAAVFMEGNYRRYLAGSNDDPFTARFDEGVPLLAEAALARLP